MFFRLITSKSRVQTTALVVVGMLLALSSVHAKEYTVNIVETWQGENQRQTVESFITELYRPLGIQPVYVYYPSQRGLDLVNRGEVDAEGFRYQASASQYTDLLMVPESLGEFQSGLFCTSQVACMNYENQAIAIDRAYVAGVEYCIKSALACQKEKSFELLNKLLQHGLSETVMLQHISVEHVLCHLETKTIFHRPIPALTSFSYHYVNRRHAVLVDALAQSLQTMKQSPEYAESPNKWLTILKQCGKSVVQLPEVHQ